MIKFNLAFSNIHNFNFNKLIKKYINALIWLFSTIIFSQTHIPADPHNILLIEKNQFQSRLPMNSNIFRPVYYFTDSTSFSFGFKKEMFYNNNAPNQENMDVRYFSKGLSNFQSISLAFNNPYFSLLIEPYQIFEKDFSVKKIDRAAGTFSVLNDRPLKGSDKPPQSGFRNLLAFINYKGIGFGFHQGNRWWGPGIHTSFQMTTNTYPIPAQIIGTMREIRIGRLGFYALYSFSKLNQKKGTYAKYFTSMNAQVTWYGPMILSAGFSRNFLTGGMISAGYSWTENDARKIIFEGFFISNLVQLDYTIGGHDSWDQTLSGYLSIVLPKKEIKLYAEMGFNDNRMYFADFLSQPDHSLATIIGVRDYGIGNNKNWLWGFEWTNLMITYTSRHRPTGPGTWFLSELYDYSTYYGRRWGPHSGTDSDDWYLYLGYLSDKLMIVPALNYERHGIVTYRPAEVKIEFRLDARYKYKNYWFGIYYERQFEAFLGFPHYFYVNHLNQPTDYYYDDVEGLANSRTTNTLIFSISRKINF